MKICLIGNSHLAAFKSGWDRIEGDYAQIAAVFFAAPAKELRKLRVARGALIPRPDLPMKRYTAGGIDRIEGNCDRYLVVGCNLSLQRLVLEARKSGPLDAVATLGETTAIVLIQRLRRITDAPVDVMPGPYHSGTSAAAAYDWPGNDEELEGFKPLFIDAVEEWARRIGFTPRFQPDCTLAGPVLTKREFAAEAVRLRDNALSDRGEDGTHMNGDYGAICLREVIGRFSEAPQ